ncbi:MAG: hypothetical protein SGPRY_010312 [Prymnesium sp.]
MSTELPASNPAQKLCDEHVAIKGLNEPFMAALLPCPGPRPNAHDSSGLQSPPRAESNKKPLADADPLEFTTAILSMLFNHCHSTEGDRLAYTPGSIWCQGFTTGITGASCDRATRLNVLC